MDSGDVPTRSATASSSASGRSDRRSSGSAPDAVDRLSGTSRLIYLQREGRFRRLDTLPTLWRWGARLTLAIQDTRRRLRRRRLRIWARRELRRQ